MTNDRKNQRDALLDELESIRNLLDERAAGSHFSVDDIPLLLPEDGIPTLLPLDERLPSDDDIPLLNEALPVQQPAPAADPLVAVRAAAARVAASATRNRPQAGATKSEQNPFLPEHLRNRLHGSDLPQHIRDMAQEARRKHEQPRREQEQSVSQESDSGARDAADNVEVNNNIEVNNVADDVAAELAMPASLDEQVLDRQQTLLPAQPDEQPVSTAATRDVDVLVDEIVHTLLPRIEDMMRNALHAALLEKKG